MAATSIVDLPQITIFQIYSQLDQDQDKINLFFSCKKLMNKKYLVLTREIGLEGFHYQSVVDCCTNIRVQNNHLRHLFNLLYNNKNTLASTNTTLQYIEPAALSPAAAAAVKKWMEMPTYTLPRVQTLRVVKRQNPSTPYLTSQQIIDFASYIPPCVTSILFDVDFIEPISTNLPDTLKHIHFSLCYNQAISEKTFPPSIESITFGNYFDKPINKGCLPDSLLHLSLGNCFDQPLPEGSLPPNLRSATFLFTYKSKTVHFPDSLRSLVVKSNRAFEKGEFPPYLEHLHFITDGPLNEYGVLPSVLKKLELGDAFNSSIPPGVLPNTLTHLIFGENYNSKIIPESLPKSLTHLKFGKYYHHKLPDQLPNLQELIFGTSFNKLIKYLPETLENLEFGDDFNQPLVSLPICLKRLQVGRNFKKSINFPQQLEEFCCMEGNSSLYDENLNDKVVVIEYNETDNRRPYISNFINDYTLSYESPLKLKNHSNRD